MLIKSNFPKIYNLRHIKLTKTTLGWNLTRMFSNFFAPRSQMVINLLEKFPENLNSELNINSKIIGIPTKVYYGNSMRNISFVL